jgi:outer membrane receptor protein involved in Fe transport
MIYHTVNDALGNFIPAYQKPSHIQGYRRTALGFAYGPRTTLQIHPYQNVELFVSYGQGYRSAQARQLDEGEQAPFAKVHALETGAQWRPWGGDVLELKAAGFATFLSSDALFDAQEGRVERIGKTSRKGVALMVQTHPWKWLQGSFSATYAKATLDEAPAPTPENPYPLYHKGQTLPYVPPWVLRADVKASHALAQVKKHALVGSVSSGLQYLSPRPLPYGVSADAVHVWDMSASLKWSLIECGVDVYNVLNTRYATTEYAYVSHWDTQSVPSRLPSRHFSAGAPRTFMGTCHVQF